MKRPHFCLRLAAISLPLSLLSAQAASSDQPATANAPATASPAPTLTGLRVLHTVTDEVPRQFTRNQSLLLRAEAAPATPGEPARAYDVLAGAYPQETGEGKVALVKKDEGASLEGETYTYLRGVRPITITRRIRTYSPATELAVWCSDKTHKTDYVFAIEGETRVTLQSSTRTPGASQTLAQGYCTRVREGPGGAAEFFDKAPLKIEDLKAAPAGSEEHRMYQFYQHVLGYAKGAGLNTAAPPATSAP
ncbi:MAG: hypothetical protein KF864_03225 [Phycisphaeraceae bacterium]|nr:hypothetical protein [Phycisphaeraceae bacterium]